MPVPFSCSRHLLAHGIVRMAVAGELDLVTVPELDEMLRGAPDEAELIILDLGAVEFMDGSGAHLLVTADRRMSQAGRRLVVVRAPTSVRRLLELARIELKLVAPRRTPAAARPAAAGAVSRSACG